MKRNIINYLSLPIILISCNLSSQVVETKYAGNQYYEGSNVYQIETKYAGTSFYQYSKPEYSVPTYGNIHERANIADKIGRYNKEAYDKMKADLNNAISDTKTDELREEFLKINSKLENLPKVMMYSAMAEDLEKISLDLKNLYYHKKVEDFIFFIEEQYENKNYNLVIEKLNQLKASNELDIWKSHLLTLAYNEIKDYSSAMSFANKLPESVGKKFTKSSIKISMEDYYGAISLYDEILKDEQYSEEITKDLVLNNKAYAQLKLKKYNEAMITIEKSLAINKDNPLSLDTKGEILFMTGKLKESIDYMNRAISISEHENSFYIRGLANIKLKKIEEGCRDLSKSFELGNSLSAEQMKKYCK